MGYKKITNFYKNKELILMFKRCYAMEKIHGTSANISFEDGGSSIVLFSGGEKEANFEGLFNKAKLLEDFRNIREDNPQIVVFGEAYGGRQQGMKDTYGDQLKFVAFEVNIGGTWEGEGRKRKIRGGVWLSVPQAERIARGLGLDFVHYEEGPTTIEWVESQRKKPSTQAKKNGISEDKITEGVVLRPLLEFTTNNGGRVISKHKNPEFSEHESRNRSKKKDRDPLQVLVQEQAKEIAEEWVVPMRLAHVLDKLIAEGDLPHDLEMSHTGIVIKAMCNDVKVEGEGEITWSSAVEKAITHRTAKLYKQKVREAVTV